ncbi:cutinase family protein [Amycolatopsis acidicola]|uniref:Cutinase family protein n=1 Tax=Amycolatopsis acidicola TaxID=2596893 RepID=A0A5N0V010_9PSEU|nr:cutinase family protein [Amycolatopsis acidicola]KAA9159751.1 cutinase family protein [Amycolatopsis acidicola]
MPAAQFARRLVAGGCAAAAAMSAVALGTATSSAATCSDVEIVFARGSGELPGLGITGGPFADAVKADLPGKTVTSYAVDYAADLAQTSAGPGATDMTRHVTSVASSCPGTKFVLGGYSQGASVTDISIGIPTLLGTGETIPSALAPRIAAVAVFGNPLRLFGQNIPANSPTYGGRAIDLCNVGDPVCANGVNVLAHLTYGFDGSATNAARFAADKVNASS